MKVLKFGAIWCQACLVMKPRWEEIEKELPWLKTEYFDYDKSKDTIKEYNVGDEIPVFIFLDNNGKEFDRSKGEIDKQKLIDFCEINKDK